MVSLAFCLSTHRAASGRLAVKQVIEDGNHSGRDFVSTFVDEMVRYLMPNDLRSYELREHFAHLVTIETGL